MNFAVIDHLFFGSCTLLISILILLKRWDEVARRWFCFSIFVTVYAIGYAFLSNNNISSEDALLASRIGTTSAAVIPVTWLYFVCSFLNIQRRRVFYVAWPLAGLFVAVGLTRFFIPSVGPAKGFTHYPEPGLIYHVHTINFFVLVSYGFYLMIKCYLQEKSDERRKEIISLFVATAFGFVGGSSEFSLIYLKDKGFDLTVLLSAYPFLMAYAMIRNRVLDIEKIADALQRERLALIGTLAASINHEIRNPLYVIKGFAESHLENLRQGVYASKEEALEKSSEILSKAIEQTQRAMEIIKRFALFAKQGSREEVQFDEVDLSRTFEEILPLVRHELELDKIQLIKEIPENLPPIHADRRHIEEIFFNLLINACQAMKNGGKLTIRAEQRNGAVEVQIKDEGPGIASDQLSKIFEPFYTTKESGTGLGLYITKQLVERNKGRISVESETNRGTRFVLHFRVRGGE